MKINSETRLLLIMGLVVLLGGGGMYFLNRTPAFTPPPAEPTPAPLTWTPDRFNQLVSEARHSTGDAKTAKVTVVEFGDLECPSCRRAFNLYLTKAEKTIPMRLIFFHFPLQQHKTAIPAAIATEAADRQGKFWPMFEALYTGIDTPLTPEYVEETAKKIGLDQAKFDKDCADPALGRLVQGDQKLGETIHVSQTPTFIVRDEKTGAIEQGVAADGVNDLVSKFTGTPKIVLPSGAPAK